MKNRGKKSAAERQLDEVKERIRSMSAAEWKQVTQENLDLVGASREACPICKGTKHEARKPVLLQGAVSATDGFLSVPLVCNECSHVRLFDLVMLGKARQHAIDKLKGK